MNRLVRTFIILSAFCGIACSRRTTTPCQKLVDAVAAHGQAAHAVGSQATQLLQVLNQPLPAEVWDIPIARADMQRTKQGYEKTLAKAAAAVTKPNDEREATVLSSQATVVALSDIGVACSGER
jgi:hypothetical protein